MQAIRSPFCTLWPCDLDLRPFDLIFIDGRRIVMDYRCAKFGDFSFSRFGFIMRTDRQTYRENHSRNHSWRGWMHCTPMVYRGDNVGVSNYHNQAANYSIFSVTIQAFSPTYWVVYYLTELRLIGKHHPGIWASTWKVPKCSFSMNKARFYKAFNNIFGKIGRNASEEFLFALIKSRCLPIVLYGIEACPTNSADLQSLQFTMNKILFKIFGAMSKEMFREISKCFGTH